MTVKRKRRKKFRYYLLMLILTCLVCFLLFEGFYFITTSKTERELKSLKYSNEAIALIIDNKLDKYLISNKIYSKTLEVALIEKKYESDYLDEYVYFPYKDYDSYITQLNKLNELGYDRNEIEQVFKLLNKTDIDVVINTDAKIDGLVSYIEDDFFEIGNLKRYVDYQDKHRSYETDKVISYVNMFLDYPFYEHDINVTDSSNLLVIVNKYYKLSSTYEPKDLVKIDAKHSYGNNTYQVRAIVKENFDKMVKDMEKGDLSIEVKSAYRSYSTQVTLYNDYVRANGKEYADSISARAGYSEHQTGLAIDIKTVNGSYATFVGSPEYKWMKDNAYKYGFIQRYPEDKTDITGYSTESWHYRYLGDEIAKYIHDHDITFDEYYANFIKK